MEKTLRSELINQLRIVAILLIGFLFIVASFSINVDWLEGLSQLEKYIYQHRFFADFFQIGALVILLLSGKLFFKLLGYFVVLIFSFIYFVQSQAYSVAGKYLPPIALENADHSDFLELDNIIFTGLIWFLFFVLMCRFLHSRLTKVSIKSAVLVSVIMLVASIFIKNDKNWLSAKTVEARFQFYNSGRPGVENKSPMAELFESLGEYFVYLNKHNFLTGDAAVLSTRAAEFAYQNYESFSLLEPDFPLVREVTFKQKIDFFAAPTAIDQELIDKKNIIVIFGEGISARLMMPYYNNFPGLTPNINEFSKSSVIKVNDYYNHTFATYRALGGQLCSMFPVSRLYEEVNYYCLGHALGEVGYQSRFMVSQRLDSTDLDTTAFQAGFDEVDGTLEIAELLSMPNPEELNIIPDRILIDGLIERLKELEQEENAKPALIGLYNFETHTGKSLREKNTVYTGTPEDPRELNEVLDTFRNFDIQFGRFWEYFKSSSLYDNTIVVLTSDHAAFPSSDFTKTMSGVNGYTELFIDQIPLLIYHPELTETVEIEAEQSNSLDLAPSLLHLLGFNDFRAPFLGTSLFSDEKSPYAKSSGSYRDMWFIANNGHWSLVSDSTRETQSVPFPEEVAKYEFIQYMESLERANKIWPAKEEITTD